MKIGEVKFRTMRAQCSAWHSLAFVIETSGTGTRVFIDAEEMKMRVREALAKPSYSVCWQPLSFVGGGSVGRILLNCYSVRIGSGDQQFLSVYLADRRIVRSEI